MTVPASRAAPPIKDAPQPAAGARTLAEKAALVKAAVTPKVMIEIDEPSPRPVETTPLIVMPEQRERQTQPSRAILNAYLAASVSDDADVVSDRAGSGPIRPAPAGEGTTSNARLAVAATAPEQTGTTTPSSMGWTASILPPVDTLLATDTADTKRVRTGKAASAGPRPADQGAPALVAGSLALLGIVAAFVLLALVF